MSYLYIDENNIIEISSDDELRNILLRFRMETLHINLLTTLIAHTGNILSLGISSDACYVMYTPVSNNPRYYPSLGNSIISNETIEFSYAGHSTEIPKHKIISFDSLLNVAIEFYLTGERPLTIIEWIED